jgi:hypothetical protein
VHESGSPEAQNIALEKHMFPGVPHGFANVSQACADFGEMHFVLSPINARGANCVQGVAPISR